MESQDRSIASKIDLLERHDLIIKEIADDLQAALSQFATIAPAEGELPPNHLATGRLSHLKETGTPLWNEPMWGKGKEERGTGELCSYRT